MTETSPEAHALSGAYAVGSLDDAESAAFEQHLAGCPSCADEVRGLRETLVRLADAVAVEPPDELRRHVLAAVRTTPAGDAEGTPDARPVAARPVAAGPVRPPLVRRPPVPRRRAVTAWAVAAALALVCLGTGSAAWVQYRSAASARELASIVTDPHARRVTARAAGGGVVQVVVGARTVVLTSSLPGLTRDRTYQLWIVRPGAISSAGLGPAGPAGAGAWHRYLEGVHAGDVVAISVEPAAGSRQPTTSPVVTLTV